MDFLVGLSGRVEVGVGEVRVLVIIATLGGRVSAEDLEERYGSKYVYSLLSRLMDKSLVKKESSGRRVDYRLTDRGFVVAKQLMAQSEQEIKHIIANFEKEFSRPISKLGISKLSGVDGGESIVISSFIKGILSSYIADENPNLTGLRLISEVLKKAYRDKDLREKITIWTIKALLDVAEKDEGALRLAIVFLANSIHRYISDLAIYSHSHTRWLLRWLKHRITWFIMEAATILAYILLAGFLLSIIIFILRVMGVISF